MLRHFTNWGTEECNCSFLGTTVSSALKPTEGVDQVATWFHSAITDIDVVSDLVLLVATGTSYTGWHVDNGPPFEVVASLLRGKKLWMFASRGSGAASTLVKKHEDVHLKTFIEDLVYGRYKYLSYCFQDVGDSVCFLARAAHFVFSATPTDQWNVLLSHNILHSDEAATQLKQKAFNRCCEQRNRVVLGQTTKRFGVTRKRFTVRRRSNTS